MVKNSKFKLKSFQGFLQPGVSCSELYLERPSIGNVEYVRNYRMGTSFILEKNVSAGFRLGKTMTEGRWGDRATPQNPFQS